jgi:heptose-I-phosphate ethanolaminephosphotransferase
MSAPAAPLPALRGGALEGGLAARVWLSALCAFLVSPPLLSAAGFALHYRTVDPLQLWAVGLSLAWVVALHVLVRRTVWLHVALLPLYLLITADLFVLHEFGARLTSGYLSIIFTDHGDTNDFVHAYSRAVTVFLAGLGLLLTLGLRAIREVRITAPRRVKIAAAVLLALAYAAPVARQVRKMPLGTAVLDVAAHDLSTPVGGLVQIAVTVAHLRETQRFLEARRGFSFGARRAPGSPAGRELYVIVIGESARADRWSLAGYGRETNPQLSRLPNLVFLRDYVATGAHTAVAVPALMSLAPITRWDDVQSQRSVVSAFREAGFDTYWLSTQEVDSWGGIVNQLAAEARARRYFSRSLDDLLVDALRDVLANPARANKLLVVLHTRGNHFGTVKYPADFRRFPDATGDWVRDVNGAYDNGILFTDSVLARTIDLVRAEGIPAAVFYASDHGENLADVDGLYGHGIGNRYDLSAAALFWYSDALARLHAEKIAAGRAHAKAQLGHDNFSPSILDLAGVKVPGLAPSRSFFSDRFTESPRWFIARSELKRYDELPRTAVALPAGSQGGAADAVRTAGASAGAAAGDTR